MSGIFISYRRQDSSYIAGRLHDHLAAQFGPGRIFRDIDTMRPGVDFVEKIEDAVSSSAAFVVVIGDQWLTAVDEQGRRRLDNADDWVRVEIAAALRRGILVVPVLVENAKMPAEAQLPDDLRRLSRYHAIDLSDQRWDYEIGQLVAVLRELVEDDAAVPPPRPTPAVPRPAVPAWAKVGIPVVVALIAAGVLLAVLLPPGPETVTPPTSTSPTVQVPTTAEAGGVTTSTRATRPTVFDGPFTATNGRLSLTVEKVEVSSDRIRVFMLVRNSTSDTLSLPASGLSAVDNEGHSYPPDPFSREWPRNLSPGETRGVVDLTEGLQGGARTLRVGWGTIFGTLAVRGGIFVPNVRVA